MASLKVYTGMLSVLKVHREKMLAAAGSGFSTATDLADYLVRKGLAFRDAHETVGKLVQHGLDVGKDLAGMKLKELQQFSGVINSDVFEVLTLKGSVESRNHIGGTAPRQVRDAVARAREQLDSGA